MLARTQRLKTIRTWLLKGECEAGIKIERKSKDYRLEGGQGRKRGESKAIDWRREVKTDLCADAKTPVLLELFDALAQSLGLQNTLEKDDGGAMKGGGTGVEE